MNEGVRTCTVGLSRVCRLRFRCLLGERASQPNDRQSKRVQLPVSPYTLANCLSNRQDDSIKLTFLMFGRPSACLSVEESTRSTD